MLESTLFNDVKAATVVNFNLVDQNDLPSPQLHREGLKFLSDFLWDEIC